MRQRQNTRGDNHAESRECASRASKGSYRNTVTTREVEPDNCWHRVVEWYRSIPQINPTDPSSIGSFPEENGAGAKSEMGEGIAASEGWVSSSQTHHVGVSTEEDRRRSKSALGEV
jgi:hypothetical protein